MDDYAKQILAEARKQEAAELAYKPPVFGRDTDGSLSISDTPAQVTASDFASPRDIEAEAFQRAYARKIKAAEAAAQKVSVPQGPTSQLIDTRETTHGDYGKTAETAQALKRAMYDARRLPRADMRESIDLICTKMARIANGDPTEPDHWRDIAGYAQLVADRLGV